MNPRSCGEKGELEMPDGEELERRLWRTVPWDAAVMTPSEENDALEEQEERLKEHDNVAGL